MAGFEIKSRDLAQDPAIQSTWYDTDIAILGAGVAGVGVLTGCAVTAQGSPDMTVAVAAGTIQAVAGGAPVAVSGGNLTITAASGSNPRVDLISASAAGVKTVTDGTAAASPKPPALPSGHIGLAMVFVGTSDTAIQNAEISDKRVFLDGSRTLLAVTQDTSGDHSLTSASQADISAGTLAVAIVSPASGNVLIRISCSVNTSTTQFQIIYLGLRESTTDLFGPMQVCRNPLSGSSFGIAVSVAFLVTGLTPGAAHTYKAAYKVSAGTHTLLASAATPAVMEAWAA